MSSPSTFILSRLPRVYESLFRAWCVAGGFCSSSGIVSICGSGDIRTPVSTVSCKSTYSRLLEFTAVVPHCVSKFRPVFGDLYWPYTSSQLFYMPLDRGVADLSWKVCHGVLFTMDPACFCGHSLDLADHLFFHCPLARSGVDWVQSLLFRSAPLAPSLVLRHVFFGFAPDELSAVPRVFVYLLHVLKYLLWNQRNDYRFRTSRPSAVALIAGLKSRLLFYLQLFFKRFRSRRRRRFFVRQWGGNGIICSLRGWSLISI